MTLRPGTQLVGRTCPNIYDMLLPYILTKGALTDDDTGIGRERQWHP